MNETQTPAEGAAALIGGCRQTAHNSIRFAAQRLRQKADELEALLLVLPPDLHEANPVADMALWRLATGIKHTP